jgi:hypothetical protein
MPRSVGPSLVIKAFSLAGTAGLLAVVLIALALRPFSFQDIPHLSGPELWLCCGVGIVVAGVCFWRLLHGHGLREELRKLEEAALGGDHLG